jgi:hypothetical protein
VKPLNMLAIYEVGKWFTLLYRSNPSDGEHFQRRYGELRQRMEECGLDRSLKAVTILQAYGRSGQDLTQDDLDGIAGHCQGMDIPLQTEVSENEVLLVPKGTVTTKVDELTKLPVLMAHQHAFIKELETCIHAGGYRSAIVMAWSLLYDYVRKWVFDNELPLLNAELTAGNRQPITVYSDFFASGAPSEAAFLDIVTQSRQTPPQKAILGSRVTNKMRPLLNERNEYAHANYQDPTLAQANVFVDNCHTVLNTAPFVV